MRISVPHIFESFRAVPFLWVLLLLLNKGGVFEYGACVPQMDNGYSLSYGATNGKGQPVQPLKAPSPSSKTTHTVLTAPITTTKTTVLEVTPIKSAPAPSKHHEPVCIDPYTLGIPTVQSCGDLKVMGRAVGTVVIMQDGLEECELMDDTSCDNGSGEGLRNYQARLGKAGGVALNANPGVGPCLSVDKKPDGRLEVKTALGWTSSILCCRPICFPTTTTTTTAAATTTAATTTAPREALLPLHEDEPTSPPYRPSPPAFPPPVYNPTPQPQPFAGVSVQIPIVTTTPPAFRAAFGEMCVMPKFLELPRVTTCEDLRDLALSTNYVELVNIRSAECAWMDDTTCGPAYPGLGAYLEGGVPNGACLAFRQTVCGNVVGPYPILGKHLKDVCRRPAIQAKGHTGGPQMMPVMMMPMQAPSKGKGGRRLERNDSDFLQEEIKLAKLSDEKDFRRLHAKGAPSKGEVTSDSVVLCCRLHCNGVQRDRGSMASATAIASTGGGGNLLQLMPSSPPAQGAAPEMRGFGGNSYNGYRNGDSYGNSANTRVNSEQNEPELCNARYYRICSLASPLNGEQIVFDQRCISENLSGCNAGGLPCCRSISLFGY